MFLSVFGNGRFSVDTPFDFTQVNIHLIFNTWLTHGHMTSTNKITLSCMFASDMYRLEVGLILLTL